jgi:hypothetical protein
LLNNTAVTVTIGPHGCRRIPGLGGIGQYVLFVGPSIQSGANTRTGGSFGKVYKAIERSTGNVVAIKQVSLNLPEFIYGI